MSSLLDMDLSNFNKKKKTEQRVPLQGTLSQIAIKPMKACTMAANMWLFGCALSFKC